MALIVLSLSACSGPDVLNAFAPDDGYRVVSDLQYRPGARGKLDLYIPDAANSTTPTIVFFYGGSWQTGSKDDYLFVGEAFASRGYVAAIPDYRLFPEIRYPAFLEDAAAAVAWLKANAARIGANGGPIYLVGHSAGGYIAAMLTLDPRWLAQAGDSACSTISATVGLAGPYDFLPLTDEALKEIFGPEPERPRTQPINHVDGAEPPMLLISGRDDVTVRPGNSHRLAARIRSRSGSVEERYYDDIGHLALVASLAQPLRGLAPTLDDVDRFLRRRPQAAAAGCSD